MSLSDHVITKLIGWKVRTRHPRLHGKNAQIGEHSYGAEVHMLEIVTDKGARGFGIGNKSIFLCQVLIGKKVSDVFDPDRGILSLAYYEADLALHDLAGKILGKSVKKMISESAVDAVSCYDGGIYMNDISPDRAPGGIEAMIDICRYDKEVRGYKDFKIKIGRGYRWMEPEAGLQRDIDVVRAIKKNFPDSKILVDANDAYSLDTTIRFLEGVKDCDICWLEEPFWENEKDLKLLKEYLAKNSPNTLIADGEESPDWAYPDSFMNELEGYVDHGLVDVVLMDTHIFGFTAWRDYLKKMKSGEKKGLASPHNWGWQLKTIYCAHLAAAYPDLIPTIEGVGDTTEGIEYTGYTMKDGMLTVPDAPGFGMELTWGVQL